MQLFKKRIFIFAFILIFIPHTLISSGVRCTAEYLRQLRNSNWSEIVCTERSNNKTGKTVYHYSLKKCRTQDGTDHCVHEKSFANADSPIEEVLVTNTYSQWTDGHYSTITSNDYFVRPNHKVNTGLSFKVEKNNNGTIETTHFELNPGIETREIIEAFPVLQSQVSSHIDFTHNIRETSRAMNNAYNNQVQNQESYLSEIRTATQSMSEHREEQRQQSIDGFAQISAELNMSPLTEEQIEAKKQSNLITQDPLQVKNYDFSLDAQIELQKSFEEKLAERALYELAKLAEKLFYQQAPSADNNAVLAKAFNQEGILKVNKVDNSMNASFIQDFKFKTNRKSPYGQVVRRTANKYQNIWGTTNGLQTLTSSEKQVYHAGVITLKQADTYLANSNAKQGLPLLNISNLLADGVSGFTEGMISNFNEQIQAVPYLAKTVSKLTSDIVEDPSLLGAYAYSIAMSAPDMADGFIAYASNFWDIVQNGSSYERGKLLGELTTDFLIGAATAGVGKTVVVAAKGIRTVSKGKKLNAIIKPGLRGLDYRNISKKSAVPLLNELEKDFFKGVKSINQHSPQDAIDLISSRRNLIKQENFHAVDYLERFISNQPRYIGDKIPGNQVANDYLKLQNNFKEVSLTSENIEVWRAVPKEVRINGKDVTLSESDVFKWHPGLKNNDYRYTLGGKYGQDGLYSSGGQKVGAWETVIKESRIDDNNIDQFWLSSKKMNSNMVLDLTDANTLKALNINKQKLLIDSQIDYSYHLTQMIGDLAEKNGIEVIKAPSFKNPNGVNYIILKKGLLND